MNAEAMAAAVTEVDRTQAALPDQPAQGPAIDASLLSRFFFGEERHDLLFRQRGIQVPGRGFRRGLSNSQLTAQVGPTEEQELAVPIGRRHGQHFRRSAACHASTRLNGRDLIHFFLSAVGAGMLAKPIDASPEGGEILTCQNKSPRTEMIHTRARGS